MSASASKTNKSPAKTAIVPNKKALVHEDVSTPKKAGGSTLKVVNSQKEQAVTTGNTQGPKKRGRKSAQESAINSAAQPKKPDQGPGRKGPGKKAGPAQVLDKTSFQTYIYRVLKEVKPELGISKQCMSLINNVLAELFIKIMTESRNLMIFSKKQTLSSKEIETAVKLLFPGELQKLAIQTSRASMQKYAESTAA